MRKSIAYSRLHVHVYGVRECRHEKSLKELPCPLFCFGNSIRAAMVYLNQNLTWYIERWLNIRIGDLFVLFVCLGFVCASVGLLLHGALKDRCLSLVDRGRCDQVSYCAWNTSSGHCYRP